MPLSPFGPVPPCWPMLPLSPFGPGLREQSVVLSLSLLHSMMLYSSLRINFCTMLVRVSEELSPESDACLENRFNELIISVSSLLWCWSLDLSTILCEASTLLSRVFTFQTLYVRLPIRAVQCSYMVHVTSSHINVYYVYIAVSGYCP